MKTESIFMTESPALTQGFDIHEMVKTSFGTIAPFWPLKNLIAVNPLHGFEDLPIEQALQMRQAYFEQADLPAQMEAINRETIKWLQAYFDEGQSTLQMPLRERGLYAAWRLLAPYDEQLYKNNHQALSFLNALPESPDQAILACLKWLEVEEKDYKQFLTLLLTTLPGWASYIKYRTEWAGSEAHHIHSAGQVDYVAIRLIITTLLWPEAKLLMQWHQEAVPQVPSPKLAQMEELENAYRQPLLKKLAEQTAQTARIPEAQLVFCIDVRSEPFRRQLELTGDYQTLGFAGFFGVPVQITDTISGASYASCPVLLKPKHDIKEFPCGSHAAHAQKAYQQMTALQRMYQSVKYTFTTPFALVESLGIPSGLWMALKSFSPSLAAKFKTKAVKAIGVSGSLDPSIDSISFEDQCAYAEGALRMMGLTDHFAPLIVLCGHGSTTLNNAYATALDCGACGGRHGASNAKILAAIINRPEVRAHLAKHGLCIPDETRFVAAEHNTTTDEVSLFCDPALDDIQALKRNLGEARKQNSQARLKKMQVSHGNLQDTQRRAEDWAQVRPEWGLARNAAFIVAPRDLTASLDLDGRCFLHSYDYKQDPEGASLTTILTAPMVVAQWINTQYLFSTIDNVAYGGGSKITKNITGKIGIMQGNASDLMTGLPLQSVYSSDTDLYHEPQRLMTVVLAPRGMIDKVVGEQPILQKLFGNGWVQMAAIDPDTRKIYCLMRDLSWQEIH